MLTHHYTKVILIFKHHINVPTKQFEQTSNTEQREMFPPPLGSSILKDALTYVNASSIHTRVLDKNRQPQMILYKTTRLVSATVSWEEWKLMTPSTLIKINMKWIQTELLALQSGHGFIFFHMIKLYAAYNRFKCGYGWCSCVWNNFSTNGKATVTHSFLR